MAQRREKLENLRGGGQDPYARTWTPTHTGEQMREAFQAGGEEAAHLQVALAGRVMALRLMGKATFVKLLDRSGLCQLYFSRDELPEGLYQSFIKKQLDLGDIIGARGRIFETKTGEISLKVQDCALLAKALRPLPEKYHGLADTEAALRYRHLDLICNPKSRQRFAKRSQLIRNVRQYLWDEDFVEVETPCLHTLASGAAALPFETDSKALACRFYLRIALELHLKRLLVGGMERVFELGRVFRNEGISRRHNPEFTLLEIYQAYSHCQGMMHLAENMIGTLAERVTGGLVIEQHDGHTVNLEAPYTRARYKDLVRACVGQEDWFAWPLDKKRALALKMGLELPKDILDFEISHQIFEKRVEPTLLQPTFVTQLPMELCPLAKLHEDKDGTLDVFELCINGQEIAAAYHEQNDPIAQRATFEAQVGEEKQKLDEDFLEALEYGMPPAGGIGIGIDRLTVLLTAAANIRDTILFPALRAR